MTAAGAAATAPDRRARWLHGAALACVATAAAAAWMQRQAAIDPAMLLAGSCLCLALTTLALAAARGAVPGWPALLVWALALRLFGLTGGPILEDDFYRYLWDGYRLVEAGTPYGAAPADFFTDAAVPPAMQEVLNGINYPELPTIYGPVQQVLFALSYLIAPARIWPLQALLAGIDLAMLGLLWTLGARAGAWLYGLSPLVLKEIAFTAHPDGFAVALIVLALWARVHARLAIAAIACGLAAAAKVFALPLIPFLLWRLKAGWWLLAALVAALAYAPFVGHGTDATSLAIFAQQWAFNPALFGLVRAALEGMGAALSARTLCGLLYLALWLWLLQRFHAATATGGWRLPRGDLIIGGLLLLSPVINAWYLLWVLPFAALAPSRTAWLASGLVLLSYLHPSGRYVLPAWLPWVEFLPLLLTLALDWRRARRRADVRTQSTEHPAGRSSRSAVS